MAGNWKMYKTPAQTKDFFTAFRPLVVHQCLIVTLPVLKQAAH